MVVFGKRFSFSAVFAALSLCLTGLAIAPAASAEKYASIVVDVDTKEVLHARHADSTRYPASLTKVMTLYMLFDALNAGELDLDDKLTVSRNAASQRPSNLKLKAGQKITVRDAIKALVVKSANDVAVVVAERLGGTEKRFAALMTAKAKQMGMKNTRFRNASGLPNSRQVSTARDLYILAESMMTDHPAYYHFFQTNSFSWNGRTYKSHNKLLGTVDGVDGMKTGYIRASGFNLMTSAKRDDRRIVVIMMGGRTAKTRNAHVKALVNAAFKQIDRSPEAQRKIAALRQQNAFEAIITPTNPNGAAVPVLNGKPFGSGDVSTEEPAEIASDNTPERTIVASTQAAPKKINVLKVTAIPDTSPRDDKAAAQSKIVSSSSERRLTSETAIPIAMSVSEYEARQFQGAGGSK